MMRQGNIFRCVRRAAAMVAVVASLAGQDVVAQGLRYQDANEDAPSGPVNVIPPAGLTIADTFVSTLPVAGQMPPADEDNKWQYRDFGSMSPGNGLPTIFQAGVTENAPTISQRLTGLAPGTSYDLYAAFWTDDDENWTIRTGLSADSLTNYSWTGAGGSFPVAGSTHGVSASAAVWDAPPLATKVGTPFLEAQPASTEPFMDPLVMLLAKAGTATANASGQIDVFVDDNPSIGAVAANLVRRRRLC